MLTIVRSLRFAAVAVALAILGMASAPIARADKLDPPDDLAKKVKADDLSISKAIGGTAGDEQYGAYLAAGEHITDIWVDWWTAIDGIRIRTNKGAEYTFGHMGGSGNHPEQTHHEHIDKLGPDDYITAIDVHVGELKSYTVITGIQIHFNGKKDAVTYGAQPTNRTLAAAKGWAIVGFWGWHGSVIDEIGIITRKE